MKYLINGIILVITNIILFSFWGSAQLGLFIYHLSGRYYQSPSLFFKAMNKKSGGDDENEFIATIVFYGITVILGLLTLFIPISGVNIILWILAAVCFLSFINLITTLIE